MPLDGGGAELPVVTRAELGYDAPAAPAAPAVEMRPLGSAPVGVDKAEADAGPPPASFAELYQFASGSEKLLLLFAVLCATGAGCSMPMMLIAFGSAFDQLGVAETLPGKSVIGEQMDKMLFTFVYIGVGMGLGKVLYIASVQYVCSSQMLKYKMAFLKAVLRQDVAWYDTSSPEELTTRFEEAMVKVQKGLSAPAFMFFEGLGYGLGSLVMAFVYEPVVAGITIAAVPLLIIPASLMMYLVEHGAKIVSSAYVITTARPAGSQRRRSFPCAPSSALVLRNASNSATAHLLQARAAQRSKTWQRLACRWVARCLPTWS
jgi:ABC-type multidrug transport system fused ATPase/permease subunit